MAKKSVKKANINPTVKRLRDENVNLKALIEKINVADKTSGALTKLFLGNIEDIKSHNKIIHENIREMLNELDNFNAEML